ncbi:enoyl-CoA hydratase, partial [archaeon]
MFCAGNMIDAQQAERDGLVAKVLPNDQLLPHTLAVAEKIASFSLPATMMCKETINAAYEMTLEEGLRFERRTFHSMFSLEDQKEG